MQFLVEATKKKNSWILGKKIRVVRQPDEGSTPINNLEPRKTMFPTSPGFVVGYMTQWLGIAVALRAYTFTNYTRRYKPMWTKHRAPQPLPRIRMGLGRTHRSGLPGEKNDPIIMPRFLRLPGVLNKGKVRSNRPKFFRIPYVISFLGRSWLLLWPSCWFFDVSH